MFQAPCLLPWLSATGAWRLVAVLLLTAAGVLAPMGAPVFVLLAVLSTVFAGAAVTVPGAAAAGSRPGPRAAGARAATHVTERYAPTSERSPPHSVWNDPSRSVRR